jgi:hypothetical protein
VSNYWVFRVGVVWDMRVVGYEDVWHNCGGGGGILKLCPKAKKYSYVSTTNHVWNTAHKSTITNMVLMWNFTVIFGQFKIMICIYLQHNRFCTVRSFIAVLYAEKRTSLRSEREFISSIILGWSQCVVSNWWLEKMIQLLPID